jgi:hypothetical protein
MQRMRKGFYRISRAKRYIKEKATTSIILETWRIQRIWRWCQVTYQRSTEKTLSPGQACQDVSFLSDGCEWIPISIAASYSAFRSKAQLKATKRFRSSHWRPLEGFLASWVMECLKWLWLAVCQLFERRMRSWYVWAWPTQNDQWDRW